MQRVSKEEQDRIRRNSRSRADELRGRPCVVCSLPSAEVHHIVPVKYGGSYGKYNMMPVCKGKCHSRVNKLSNHWCKRNLGMPDVDLREKIFVCRNYIKEKVMAAKMMGIKRALEKELDLIGL